MSGRMINLPLDDKTVQRRRRARSVEAGTRSNQSGIITKAVDNVLVITPDFEITRAEQDGGRFQCGFAKQTVASIWFCAPNPDVVQTPPVLAQKTGRIPRRVVQGWEAQYVYSYPNSECSYDAI